MTKSNLDIFWSMFKDDLHAANEIAALFCKQMHHFLYELESAKMSKDVAEGYEVLHKIKGSISFLGFVDEFDYLDQLESNLKQKDVLISVYELSSVKAKINDLIFLFKNEVL